MVNSDMRNEARLRKIEQHFGPTKEPTVYFVVDFQKGGMEVLEQPPEILRRFRAWEAEQAKREDPGKAYYACMETLEQFHKWLACEETKDHSTDGILEADSRER